MDPYVVALRPRVRHRTRCSAPSASAVEATAAYCDYVFRRYGRFPAYTAPFRTVIGFQVCRLDVDFYDRFYEPEALSDSVRHCTKQAQECNLK